MLKHLEVNRFLQVLIGCRMPRSYSAHYSMRSMRMCVSNNRKPSQLLRSMWGPLCLSGGSHVLVLCVFFDTHHPHTRHSCVCGGGAGRDGARLWGSDGSFLYRHTERASDGSFVYRHTERA